MPSFVFVTEIVSLSISRYDCLYLACNVDLVFIIYVADSKVAKIRTGRQGVRCLPRPAFLVRCGCGVRKLIYSGLYIAHWRRAA